jgi:hypothetical protein
MAWTKAHVNKRVVGAAEGARVAELEQTNTKLLTRLKLQLFINISRL